MTNPYRAIRQFERFLFRGAPEHPESIWQRTTNANVEDRYTGKSQKLDQCIENDIEGCQLISTIIYKQDKEQIEIIPQED